MDMDLFGLQNLHNFELIGAGKINEKLSYRIGFQSFFLVQKESDSWYNAGLKALRTPDSEVENSHVGNEIDLAFHTNNAEMDINRWSKHLL